MSQSLATTPPAPADAPAYNPRNYLNAEAGIASWLLTRDHKRIAIMYLVLTTLSFALGGFFAMLIRIELLTPGPTIMSAMSYNRMFTLHGVVMIFLFMIPAILLSGNMTPIIAMPAWIQPVTWLNPLRWFIEILRANLLEGSGMAELWRHALALLAIGTVLFVTAVRRFRTTLG